MIRAARCQPLPVLAARIPKGLPRLTNFPGTRGYSEGFTPDHC